MNHWPELCLPVISRQLMDSTDAPSGSDHTRHEPPLDLQTHTRKGRVAQELTGPAP